MVSFAWWPMLPSKVLQTLLMNISPITLIHWGVITSCSLIILLLWYRYKPLSTLSRNMQKICVKCGYFFVGVIIACVYCNWIGHQYSNAINSIDFNTPMWVQGRVTTLQNTEHHLVKKSTVVLHVSHINHQQINPILIRLNWYYPKANLRQGQEWQLLVKLKPARGLANQAGFDYQRYLMGQHIVATGYIKPHDNNAWVAQEISLAQRLSLTIQQHHLSHGAWVNALMLGHKHALSIQDKKLIINTGTAHLFVISGLHIGVAAGWIGLICHVFVRLLAMVCRYRGLDISRVSPLVTMGLILVGTYFYCLLLGFTIPMLRAFTVITLWLSVNYWHIQMRFLHKYLLCLMVVCVVFPMSSFNVGFWLSFAAVSAIVFVTHIMRFDLRTWPQKIRAFIGLQIALSCLLVPINIMFFQQWLPASFLANLWAIPWVTIILVPLCMLTLVVGLWGEVFPDSGGNSDTLFTIGLRILDYGFTGLISGLNRFNDNEVLQLVFSPISVSLSLTICLLLLLIIGLALLMHRQYQAQIMLCLIVCGAVFVWQSKPVATALHLMDVGQGSGAILVINNEAVVFDVGDDFGDSFNMVDHVIQPFLQRADVDTVKAAYISHDDKDHAGGIERLSTAFPNMSVVNEQQGCVSGYEQRFHHAQLTVLWPPKRLPIRKNNDRSCVIQLQIGQVRVLFTGDIEAFAEKQLIIAHDQGRIALQSDILIVPHHGSASSSSLAFIQRVAPRYAIISAGYMNRYQLPKKTIVARYHNAEIPVLNTAQVGQVTILFSDDNPDSFTLRTKRGSDFTNVWAYRWYQFD